MRRAGTPRSLWCVVAILIAGILTMHQLRRPQFRPSCAPLADFPQKIRAWSGQDIPLSEHIVRAVGLDEYVNRIYRAPRQGWVTLFISYYRSQRTGQTIHSPKNCLPGAGWQPVYSRRLRIPLAHRAPLYVNEYDVVRDTRHVLVLYWYRERGREIASEYAAKFWLTFDALTRNRTDGALIRVTAPIAERLAIGFVQTIFPRIGRFIPN